MKVQPDLSDPKVVGALQVREHPYWNILEYCRHIGVSRRGAIPARWVARVRRKTGNYKQVFLGPVTTSNQEGMDYESALAAARNWFASPEIQLIASNPYPAGTNKLLKYTKTISGFTIGDALYDFVEWKRVAAAETYFDTSLSLINHHIIPRLGDKLLCEFTSREFTAFCVDVLESPPVRGKQPPKERVPIASLDHERLRKRKKTLNTLVSILRTAFRMAWENGEIESDRAWRLLRRIPHADVPRHYFLTRKQAKLLVRKSRPDLAKLVLAALYSGCRVSELATLKVRDVGGHFFGIYVSPLKSYRGRHVFLPDEGMSFFLDQCERKGEEDYVFRMQSGKNWTGCHKHLFKQAVRDCGLPERFVFHGLRHTYASQLVQAGTPLAIIARQLGHSNTDSVSRTYGHLSCATIEDELSARFAPLTGNRRDPRLARLRGSLQAFEEYPSSWPKSNHSQSGGDVVELLKDRDEAHAAAHRRRSRSASS